MRPSFSELPTSERPRRAGRLARALLGLATVTLAGALASGCVMVRPEQREYLADPAMTFGSEGTAAAQEEHVISNREGSYGGSTVTGGGCGCN